MGGWECGLTGPPWKSVWRFLRELNRTLLGVCLQESKSFERATQSTVTGLSVKETGPLSKCCITVLFPSTTVCEVRIGRLQVGTEADRKDMATLLVSNFLLEKVP